MSQTYPCPNPMCTHQFSAQDLSGVASVACPKCGMVIQLRAAPPKPPPPPPTVPLAPTLPMSQITAPPDTAFETGPGTTPIVRTRKRGKSRDALTYTLAIGGFLLLSTFALLGSFVAFKGGVNKALGGKGGFKNSAYNYTLDKPTTWDENPAMKNMMGVSELALKRAESPAYFALDVVDYKDRNPSPSELDDEARRKLKAMFTKNLETEPARGKLDEADAIAGQPAHRVVFVGETAELSYKGEVAYFANQGLGYWIYSMAVGDVKPFEDDFKQLRKSFALIGERPEFKKSQSQQQVYAGDKVKGYQLTDTSGRWKLEENPTDHDPDADIVLRAMDPQNPKKPTMAVDLVVMSLKPAGDPVETARKHIAAKYAREGSPGAKIRDDEGGKEGLGNPKGQLLHWRVNVGEGAERFAVVGVVPRGTDVLVLFGDCPYDRRYTWESPLQQMIESIKVPE